MGKKLGNDYRVWVESAVAGTFNEIKGNTALSISRSGGAIDTSSKETFPYGTQAAGARSVSIQATFRPDLPDAQGYGRLATNAKALVSTPFLIQVRKGGSAGVAPGDVVFEGSVYVTDFNDQLGLNEVVETSVTFVLAAAPVTDTLL